MAYQYDQLGNVIGEYESEEERRLREQANQPVKQTTVYNPDGTSEVTIKGTPEALSSANPNTPTVTGPVSPDETYNRMLQAESGNRNFLPNGQPVTSTKGAMFASQVMPSTAANPGYGVRPAQNQTPEEYNRVGKEYFQALVKQFGGDVQKAAAAYNAGPGRVQQNISQNQGQMNVAQLPRETQGYLQKIGNVVSNMIPSAQAGTLPQQPAPVTPAQLAQPAQQVRPASTFQGQTNEFGGMEQPQPSQYSLATGMAQPGLRAPSMGQPSMQPDSSMYMQQYQQFQDDPQSLIKMGYNENTPDWLKDRAKNRAAELITQQRELDNAKKQIPDMTESEIARALRERTTGGSYLKAALFGILGMENSAMAEAAKLGVGKETMTQINGQPAMIKMAANGTPIEGYNAITGKRLTPEELIIGVQYGTAQKGAQTHTGKMQDMKTGEVYYERTTPQGIELVDNNGKKYAGSSANLRPFGIGSDIQTKNQIQVNELTNKLAFAGPTERAKIVAENEAKFGPLDPAVRAQALGQVIGVVPTQATQVPATTATTAISPAGARPVATVAPAVTAPTTTVAPAVGQTIAQREAQQTTGIKRTESFNKILDEEVRPQAQAGDTVSSVRKQQFQIFDRPGVDSNKLFGLYNASQENPNDQKLSIVRDIFGGVFKPEQEVSQRLALLNLSPQEKSALIEYNIANQRINAATLKQTAGPGSVSDAEQRANRESNVDPTKVPALGAYNAMAQSQFNGDLARYKADWAENHTATNALQLDKAWRKEQATLSDMYGNIAKQRAQYIAGNGATTAAVRDGYKKFPIPEYDPNSGSWKKTKPLAEILGR